MQVNISVVDNVMIFMQYLLWNFNNIKNFGDYMILVNVLSFSFIRKANPMPHYIMTDGPYILRNNITPSLYKCESFCRECKINRSSGRCSVGNHIFKNRESIFFRITTREDYIQNIVLDFLIHINFPYNIPGSYYIFSFQNCICCRELLCKILPDYEFLLSLIHISGAHETRHDLVCRLLLE